MNHTLTLVIHNYLKRSQFCVMNDIVNDKKGHNIVNDSFADKPHSFLVLCRGITRIHRSPSRLRPAVRPTAAFINIHEHPL